MLFSDACPPGQAVIGYGGKHNGSNLGQIQAYCGTVTLPGSAPYSVIVTGADILPLHGTSGSFNWKSTCPANQVVVGFRSRVTPGVVQLTLRCAPLLIKGPPYELSVGPVVDLPPVGGLDGSATPQTECIAGQVAIVSLLRASTAVDSFGLGCSTPTLTF